MLARRQLQNLLLGGLGAVQETGHVPFVDYHDAVAHTEDLGQLGTDHDNRNTLLCELVDQLVDFDLGADVNTAVWARQR